MLFRYGILSRTARRFTAIAMVQMPLMRRRLHPFAPSMSFRTTTRSPSGAWKMQRKSLIVWEGPSSFNGEPIQVILTSITRKSVNPKTGKMVQAYILPVNEKPNRQRSICGYCPIKEACYVTWYQDPRSTWASKNKERIPYWVAADIIAGRMLRIGAAGDPAMVPLHVWGILTSRVKGWTGYTHQWRTCDEGFARYVMASVESSTERLLAKAKGYRTFRIRASIDSRKEFFEFVCPASTEGGHRSTCEKCGLCAGTSSKANDVVIIAHGRSANRLLPILGG